MSEKTLITSKPSKSARKIFLTIIAVSLALALIFFLIEFGAANARRAERMAEAIDGEYVITSSGGYKCDYRWCTKNFKTFDELENHFFEVHVTYADNLYIWWGVWRMVVCYLFLFIALATTVVWLIIKGSKITITDKNISGRTVWGKQVVLPLHQVSAYATRKFLSKITVATSSGTVGFVLIDNYQEIADVLQKLLNEIQEKTSIQTTSAPTQTSNLGDLEKLKDYLDKGIITQEEYDAKKREILGL